MVWVEKEQIKALKKGKKGSSFGAMPLSNIGRLRAVI